MSPKGEIHVLEVIATRDFGYFLEMEQNALVYNSSARKYETSDFITFINFNHHRTKHHD